MPIDFTKMHGIGNDFIVINALTEPLPFDAKRIRQLSHRRFGIGFDQLLVVEPPTSDAAEFNYRIFNADGGGSRELWKRSAVLCALRQRKRVDHKRADRRHDFDRVDDTGGQR